MPPEPIVRGCSTEANAIVTNPKAGRELCRDAVLKYLGPDVVTRFSEKKDDVIATFEEIQERTGIIKPLREAYDLLKGDDEEDEEDESDN